MIVLGVWGSALLFYGFGDTGLTIVVHELGGFETNPIAQTFLQTFGYAGLIFHKMLIIGVLAALWHYFPTVSDLSPDPWRLIIPALATIRGISLVSIHVHNIGVLL